MWVPIDHDEFMVLFASRGDLVSQPGAMELTSPGSDNTCEIIYFSVIWKQKGKEYLLVQVIADKEYHNKWAT